MSSYQQRAARLKRCTIGFVVGEAHRIERAFSWRRQAGRQCPSTLVVHELATNAAKHGALTHPAGSVLVRWDIHADGTTRKLRFLWQERGGPKVRRPARKGFGTLLLEHAIAGMDSAPSIEFAPAGLTYQTETPLDMLTPQKE